MGDPDLDLPDPLGDPDRERDLSDPDPFGEPDRDLERCLEPDRERDLDADFLDPDLDLDLDRDPDLDLDCLGDPFLDCPPPLFEDEEDAILRRLGLSSLSESDPDPEDLPKP